MWEKVNDISKGRRGYTTFVCGLLCPSGNQQCIEVDNITPIFPHSEAKVKKSDTIYPRSHSSEVRILDHAVKLSMLFQCFPR